MNKLLSVKEASSIIGISEQQVRILIRNQEIAATKVGIQWVIDSISLEEYVRSHITVLKKIDRSNSFSHTNKPTALSFFTGAMGLDIGIEKAGFECLLACEIDKACRSTISTNRPDTALIGDIWNYNATQIFEMAGIEAERGVDLVFGGPPCQAFSTAGSRKSLNDARGNVFTKYLDLIREIKPKYFVIENVRGLLSIPMKTMPDKDATSGEYTDIDVNLPGSALKYIVRKLQDAGYSISFNLYNSANFGTPQIRERLVIIGCLGDRKVHHLTPTHSEHGEFGLPRWRTLRDALESIGDLPHHYVTFPPNRLRFFKLIKEGQNWRSLPKEMQIEALGKSYYLGGGKTGFYRRLSYDKPSPTLVTHPAMPATDLAHPVEDRPLSVEEYRAIQEFPEEWVFCGSIINQYRQIGNAVPIRLGIAIGKAILEHMESITPIEYPGFRYSRYSNTDENNYVMASDEVQKALII